MLKLGGEENGKFDAKLTT